ncbi:hypothetical protein NQ314_010164 [Rhamnusium bicolor]|uniref:Uncharacterized protein n=1 Tax=Rhamnusium bicolor TaxID=1586634 RepID=A0AAV8XSK8_9CUCU|nr:hypothetical protein NQ314_010164 [Rhamnusium bicolor]
MGLINLVKIKRRRHGNYETALDSKRQTSISYTVPNQDGNFVQVYRKTFMNIFDVTQKRLVGPIHFPNLSFHRPRVDTCHTCDRLNCEAKQNNSVGIKAKSQLDLHHRKVEKSMEYMRKETTDSQLPGSDKCCISFDLQQVLFVPTLTHSDMFYLSQLPCYNLGINLSDTNRAFMCMWHEGVSGRGGNEIASTILKVLNSGITEKKNICYCGVTTVWGKIKTECRHSFMCCDRDFALIEKRKRVMKAIIQNDLHKVITFAKYDPLFEVVDMSVNGFWDIKEAADTLLNTKNSNMSKAVRIKVDCKNPTVLLTKESFSDVEAWKQVNILKKGKTIGDLKSAKIALLLPICE